ncbi:MAG: glycine betaine/L-proline ABC transporter ATP-binding protein [Bacteroidales bacterium]
MKEKIVVKNLTKIFGRHPGKALDALKEGKSKADILNDHNQVVGVYDVSFEVHEKEIFVLMGLSGSGKSTLERLLNRLHEPTTGEILIDGTDITKLNTNDLREFRRKHFCGMVFQNFGILPHRTVAENVEFGLELQGVDKDKRREKAMKVIEQVGLTGNEHSYPSQLSGGMQQRVGLARGLSVDAGIMLMDEAFSALDPLIRRQMQDELLELQDTMQKTIIFVTHDLDEAFRIGDRIAIMKDGRIEQIGTAEEIISKPASDYVRAFVEDMNRAAVLTAGAIMQPTVERAFPGDGPRTILRKIRKNNLTGILMTDTKRNLKGYIRARELVDYLNKHKEEEKVPFDDSLVHQPSVVTPDMSMTEVMNIYNNTEFGPLAVVDEDNKLQGVIAKGNIISALSEQDDEAIGQSEKNAD